MNLQLERKYTDMQSTRIKLRDPGLCREWWLPGDHIFSSVVRELRWGGSIPVQDALQINRTGIPTVDGSS